MKNRWALVAVAVVIVAVAGYWYTRSGDDDVIEVDLIARLDTAEKRSQQPPGEIFTVVDQDINGEVMKAINVHPDSRITWKVHVPQNAWLRTALGIKPGAWSKEGDGVLFRVGVSQGGVYEELLKQHVNPAAVGGDRRWIPVTLDLSPFADHDVEIIFNTNASLPGAVDSRNDWAVWGHPQVFLKN